MLATITNTSGAAMNAPDTFTSGVFGPSQVVAVGGNRTNPLPAPFNTIGSLANGATKQLPMHPRDWRYKAVPWLPHEAGEDFRVLLQAGKITLAFAAEVPTMGAPPGGRTDPEELFFDVV